MKELTMGLQFIFLLIMFASLLYSFVYVQGILKTKRDFGIRLPENIHGLLVMNMLLSITGVLVLTFFLLKTS